MDTNEHPTRRRLPIKRHRVDPGHTGRLRVGTLTMIRWIAAAGQAITVVVVQYGFDFEVPLSPCFAAIGALAASNIWLAWRRSPKARLGDQEAALVLGFDVVQLGTLLFLTGGLLNPFIILILAPVTVSATVLSRTATAVLVALAIVFISLLATLHMPLPWRPGEFALPLPYLLGVWTSLSVAAMFVSAYVWSVAEEARNMSEALAETRQALAREQRFTALGGLAAAAAHELGSPLATIAVVAKELQRSLAGDGAYADDVDLLISQSDRCREILADLSRRPEARGAAAFERVPFSTVVHEAAEPHRVDGVLLDIAVEAESGATEPAVVRSPEVLLAVGTLIQNALQFARSRVEVTVYWSDSEAEIAIEDDGRGFPPHVLAVIGEPYVSSRAGEEGHMGLGIFIAQTLLERTGAELRFANRGGAEVVIRWPRAMLEALELQGSGERRIGVE